MTAYDALFNQSATKWGVPKELLEAIAWTESSMNPKAYRAEPRINDASYGLMQLLEKTARGLGFTGTKEQLYDPAINIDLGGKLSAQIIKRQGGLNLADFYSEYNSGRSQLWKTSAQVATHVSNFLRNIAKVLNIELPKNVNIEDALKIVGSVSSQSLMPVLAVLGLILFFKK